MSEMTHTQVAQAISEGAVAVFPIGSQEQHGHMPCGTDFIIAERLGELINTILEGAGFRTVLTPTLNFGMSEHHTAFAGTMSLTPGLFIAVVEDLLRDLYRMGFRLIVISNGHGGNHNFIDNAIKAAQTFCRGLEVVNKNVPFMIVSEDYRKKFEGNPKSSNHAMDRLAEKVDEKELSHADACEASLLFSFRPELKVKTVDVELPPNTPRLPDLTQISGIRNPVEWKEKTAACAGGKGDPRYALPAMGHQVMFEVAMEILKEVIGVSKK